MHSYGVTVWCKLLLHLVHDDQVDPFQYLALSKLQETDKDFFAKQVHSLLLQQHNAAAIVVYGGLSLPGLAL